MHQNVDLKDFKGRKGLDRIQYLVLCWIGFMGFVAFRLCFCYTLLMIRYAIWLAGKALYMPDSIVNSGELIFNTLVRPIDLLLKYLINYRDPKTGKRTIPKWNIIPDTFKAARVSPRMYRNGWVTLAVVVSYGSLQLVERFTA